MATTERPRGSETAQPASPAPETGAPPVRPLWQRLTWLVVIWAASVMALGALAWGIRQFMQAAGLSTP
ncbi:DUF2474 domain-containing protein [Stutzerimonas nitrititolerans]|uniref:DUF2474 domain-containing protein n=1 Tax=Stutzerimonas nitrititolerans TaxID=2482751 RepID=UPI0035E3D3CA